MAQSLRDVRTALIAKGRQGQNHTLHTQVKARGSGQALTEAGARSGLSVPPVPRSGPGFWGSVRQGQPGQHPPALPSWQSRYRSAEAPALLLPDSPCIQLSRLGATSQGQQGPTALSDFFSQRKDVSEANPSLGWTHECWDGEEADLCPDKPRCYPSVPQNTKEKKRNKQTTFFLLHSNTLK